MGTPVRSQPRSTWLPASGRDLLRDDRRRRWVAHTAALVTGLRSSAADIAALRERVRPDFQPDGPSHKSNGNRWSCGESYPAWTIVGSGSLCGDSSLFAISV